MEHDFFENLLGNLFIVFGAAGMFLLVLVILEAPISAWLDSDNE